MHSKFPSTEFQCGAGLECLRLTYRATHMSTAQSAMLIPHESMRFRYSQITYAKSLSSSTSISLFLCTYVNNVAIFGNSVDKNRYLVTINWMKETSELVYRTIECAMQRCLIQTKPLHLGSLYKVQEMCQSWSICRSMGSRQTFNGLTTIWLFIICKDYRKNRD